MSLQDRLGLLITAIGADMKVALGVVSYARLPAGSRIAVTWTSGGGWPARPTSRTDIYVDVRAPLSAGTPPTATPPATTGYYTGIDTREILPEP